MTGWHVGGRDVRPTARRLGVCAETLRRPHGRRAGSVGRSETCNGPGAAPWGIDDRTRGMLQLRATFLPFAKTRTVRMRTLAHCRAKNECNLDGNALGIGPSERHKERWPIDPHFGFQLINSLSGIACGAEFAFLYMRSRHS